MRDKEDQDVTKDAQEIVSALRVSLADKIGTTRCELWFGPATRLTPQPHGLLVEVPNLFLQNWMRANLRKEMEAACEEVLGKEATLEFRVDEKLAAKASTSTSGPLAVEPPRGEGNAAPAENGLRLPFAPSTEAPPDGPALGVKSPAGAFQRTFASLESFVVGPCNRLAHASAQLAIENPGKVSPLFLHGPTGVGKTHLLEGIWTAARTTRRDVVPMYLSAEQFTTQFLDSLHRTVLPNFRGKLRRVNLLIIDDIQFFSGKKATVTELQNTIDAFLREGKQLIFAADQPPADMVELGKELSSRMAGGLVCGLEPADHQTRLGILRRFSAERNLTIADDVLEYIAARLTSHARELSGALHRLQVASRCANAPITRPLAEEALNVLIRTGRGVQLRDIETAVCKTLGLSPDSLQSDRRAKNISYPRMLAMWLARKHTRAALSEIGHFFGGRSHSTVISASKTVAGWMSSQKQVALADQTWPIEDAIRRVEQQLRIG